MKKKRNLFYNTFSPILGILAVLMNIYIQLHGYTFFNIKGLSSVIESVMNLGSIVIGFYSAFYGILVSIQKNKFMELLNKSKYKKVMPRLLTLALITAFLSVIISIILQVLINYSNHFILGTSFFYLWIFVSVVFIAYAFQTSMLAIYLIFDSDVRKKKTISSK